MEKQRMKITQLESGGDIMKIMMKMKDLVKGRKRNGNSCNYISEKHEECYRFEVTKAFDTTAQNKGVSYDCDNWLYRDKVWKYYF